MFPLSPNLRATRSYETSNNDVVNLLTIWLLDPDFLDSKLQATALKETLHSRSACQRRAAESHPRRFTPTVRAETMPGWATVSQSASQSLSAAHHCHISRSQHSTVKSVASLQGGDCGGG